MVPAIQLLRKKLGHSPSSEASDFSPGSIHDSTDIFGTKAGDALIQSINMIQDIYMLDLSHFGDAHETFKENLLSATINLSVLYSGRLANAKDKTASLTGSVDWLISDVLVLDATSDFWGTGLGHLGTVPTWQGSIASPNQGFLAEMALVLASAIHDEMDWVLPIATDGSSALEALLQTIWGQYMADITPVSNIFYEIFFKSLDKLVVSKSSGAMMVDDPADIATDLNGITFIQGSDAADTLYGNNRNDFIRGGDGYNLLYGKDGNDILVGGVDADTLYGGRGADVLFGGDGDDILQGDVFFDPQNYATTAQSDDWFFAGAGRDILLHSYAGRTVLGWDGGWKLSTGMDNELGGTQTDRFSGIETIQLAHGGNDFIILGNTGDYFDTVEGGLEIIGGGGPDSFSMAADLESEGMFGGAFTINGGGGVNTMHMLGESGQRITFGEQNVYRHDDDTQDRTLWIKYFNIDKFYAGVGDDVIAASTTQSVYGENGADTITGNGLDNRMYGGAGNDTILGHSGEDTLYGGADDDTLKGGDDNDTLYGGSGSDTLEGGDGDDILFGGWSDNIITNDTNILIGGRGSDTFIFTSDFERQRLAPDMFHIDGNSADSVSDTSIDRMIFENVLAAIDLESSTATFFGGYISFVNIEEIVAKNLHFQMLETPEDGMIVDFSDFAGRVFWRNSQVVETISGNLTYSGAQATILGADVIKGTQNADFLQGSEGQTLYGQGGVDRLDINNGDAFWGGDGIDVFRWSLTAPRTAPEPQIVHDFALNEAFVVMDITASALTWSEATLDSELAGALATHTSGRSVFFVDRTVDEMKARTIHDVGNVWVGTPYVDNASFSSSIVAYALGGNDVLKNTGTNGSHRVTMYGGAGNDRFEAQNNQFFAKTTVSYADAPKGVDVRANGTTIQDGFDGQDTLVNMSTPGSRINGSAYDDRMESTHTKSNSHSAIYGGAGNDTLYARSWKSTVYGDGDDDIIYGNSAPNTGSSTLRGGAGNDTLVGRTNSGDDYLYGEADDDYLRSFTGGKDNLYGGSGQDLLYTGRGTIHNGDNLWGGSGFDVFAFDERGSGLTPIVHDYTAGEDVVVLTTRFVNAHGSAVTQSGADVLIGGSGGVRLKNTLVADVEVVLTDDVVGYWNQVRAVHTPPDPLLVASTTPTVMVEEQESVAFMGRVHGDDVLLGSGAHNTLYGGTDNSQMMVAAPGEVFVFSSGGGQHVLTGFVPGSDLLEIDLDVVMDEANFLASFVTITDGYTDIDIGNGSSIRLMDIAGLSVDDFVLV